MPPLLVLIACHHSCLGPLLSPPSRRIIFTTTCYRGFHFFFFSFFFYKLHPQRSWTGAISIPAYLATCTLAAPHPPPPPPPPIAPSFQRLSVRPSRRGPSRQSVPRRHLGAPELQNFYSPGQKRRRPNPLVSRAQCTGPLQFGGNIYKAIITRRYSNGYYTCLNTSEVSCLILAPSP